MREIIIANFPATGVKNKLQTLPFRVIASAI